MLQVSKDDLNLDIVAESLDKLGIGPNKAAVEPCVEHQSSDAAFDEALDAVAESLDRLGTGPGKAAVARESSDSAFNGLEALTDMVGEGLKQRRRRSSAWLKADAALIAHGPEKRNQASKRRAVWRQLTDASESENVQ